MEGKQKNVGNYNIKNNRIVIQRKATDTVLFIFFDRSIDSSGVEPEPSFSDGC